MPLFQRPQSRGFTLLELLIVMVIVALMVTMVVLNVNLGRGDSQLKDASRRLHAVLQLASEESILFNKSLGIKFEGDKYSFYELLETQAREDPDDPKSELKKEQLWELIAEEGNKKAVFSERELPEYHRFTISIEGSAISLQEEAFSDIGEKKKNIKPTLFITPDGEIFPDFDIQIQDQESNAFASIKLNEDGELVLKIDAGEGL